MHDSPDHEAIEKSENPTSEWTTDWDRIKAMTGDEARRNALADDDNPPLTDEQLARLRRVPNPQEIRQRLGLTQRAFAKQFQIALGTLRDWEQGARRPDSAAKAYLRVIEEAPDVVRRILQTEQDQRAVPAGLDPVATYVLTTTRITYEPATRKPGSQTFHYGASAGVASLTHTLDLKQVQESMAPSELGLARVA